MAYSISSGAPGLNPRLVREVNFTQSNLYIDECVKIASLMNGLCTNINDIESQQNFKHLSLYYFSYQLKQIRNNRILANYLLKIVEKIKKCFGNKNLDLIISELNKKINSNQEIDPKTILDFYNIVKENVESFNYNNNIQQKLLVEQQFNLFKYVLRSMYLPIFTDEYVKITSLTKPKFKEICAFITETEVSDLLKSPVIGTQQIRSALSSKSTSRVSSPVLLLNANTTSRMNTNTIQQAKQKTDEEADEEAEEEANIATNLASESLNQIIPSSDTTPPTTTYKEDILGFTTDIEDGLSCDTTTSCDVQCTETVSLFQRIVDNTKKIFSSIFSINNSNSNSNSNSSMSNSNSSNRAGEYGGSKKSRKNKNKITNQKTQKLKKNSKRKNSKTWKLKKLKKNQKTKYKI